MLCAQDAHLFATTIRENSGLVGRQPTTNISGRHWNESERESGSIMRSTRDNA